MARYVLLLALVASLSVSLVAAAPVSEVEPNDQPADANALVSGQEMTGAIEPVGDVDYYALAGINTAWGFIALLDTSAAAAGGKATLEALGSDGAVLQSDSGSWARGAAIALQSYADGRETHYLRVREAGDDGVVSSYALRMYDTVVDTQPEAEPNEERITGTPSSFTHEGTISAPADRDCFAFHGRAGDRIIVALDASGPLDAELDLVDPEGEILGAANLTGPGGKEFVESEPLPSEGAYAYCVSPAVGSGTGASATYRVGLVRNGRLYFPDFEFRLVWLNRPPAGYAKPGDILEFQMTVTNTSPLVIPGGIDLSLSYPAACFSLVDADPPPTLIPIEGEVWWRGLKPDLAPGETCGAAARLRADGACVEVLYPNLGLPYYFSGIGDSMRVAVYDRFVHLPVALRAAP